MENALVVIKYHCIIGEKPTVVVPYTKTEATTKIFHMGFEDGYLSRRTIAELK